MSADVLATAWLASFDSAQPPDSEVPAQLGQAITDRSTTLLGLVKLLHQPLTSSDPAERAKGALTRVPLRGCGDRCRGAATLWSGRLS